MIFSYRDVIKALDDANEMLLSVQSNDELVISTNYDYFTIYSKNRITGVKTLIIDNAYRDEGYRFLEGFITGLMIPRLKDLETNHNTNDDTRIPKEEASVPAKTHFSWVGRFKQWF